MPCSGWYQVTFDERLTRELNAIALGPEPLALVRSGGALRAFSAVCPHRGANLACGGRLERGALVCPFHGNRIGLDAASEIGFRAREYPCLSIGGLVFVRATEAHDHGFPEQMAELARTHLIVPGFELPVRATPELISENGFDSAHFRPVHEIGNEPTFRTRRGTSGELIVEGEFLLPPSPWQPGRAGYGQRPVPYRARAFSPGLVVSELGGEAPYSVVTAATPQDGSGASCIIQLSLAIPRREGAAPPSRELCNYLLRQSRTGLEKDRAIWERIEGGRPSRFVPADAAVLEFREFLRHCEHAECAQ
jgi:nitrite reductase/ring-hydroxylating ferredoxin subunit